MSEKGEEKLHDLLISRFGASHGQVFLC